jgi:hypothetical protein
VCNLVVFILCAFKKFYPSPSIVVHNPITKINTKPNYHYAKKGYLVFELTFNVTNFHVG